MRGRHLLLLLVVARYVASEPVPDALRELGVTAYEVNRPLSRAEDALPVTVVVAHREFMAGCHSFERFIGRRWETIMGFEEPFVSIWRLRELVRSATNSPGIHLLSLDRPTGEWLMRAAALRLSRAVGGAERLMLSAQCDIQPLPAIHALHESFERTLERMVGAFLREAALRARGGAGEVELAGESFDRWQATTQMPARCIELFKRSSNRTLFLMNTVIVETVPLASGLKGAHFHAIDLGGFMAGKKPRARPAHAGATWLSDVSSWVEDHFVLYDAALLEPLAESSWRIASTISEGVRVVPRYACEKGLAAVRNNDVVLFYDRAHETLLIQHGPQRLSLFNSSAYAQADVGRLVRHNLDALSREASPLGCLRESMAIRAHLGYYLPAACAFATFHLRAEHARVPNAAARVRDEEATFTGLMRLAGMHVVGSNQTSLSFARLPFYHARGKLVQPGAPAPTSAPRIAAPNGAVLVDEGWLRGHAFADLKTLFRARPDNVITFEKDMVLGPRMFSPFDYATHGKSCAIMRPPVIARYAQVICEFIDTLKAGRLPWLGTPAGAEMGRHLLPELGRLHDLCLRGG